MMPVLSLGETLGYSLLWQGLWFWLVWSAGHDATAAPLAATAVVLVLAAWRVGPAWPTLLRLIAVAVAWGVIGDGLLAASGVVVYASPNQLASWCPPWWILALWAQFAAALALPLRRVLVNPWVGLMLGLVSGPLAYVGGQALGSIGFPGEKTLGLVGVAVVFGIGTPLLVIIAKRWFGEMPAQPVVQGV